MRDTRLTETWPSIPSGYCLALLSTALSIASCAGAPTRSEQPVVAKVQWLPACSLNVSDPYFSVEVSTDGAVKYLGGPQAREIGERVERVQPESALRVVTEALHFVNGPGGPTKKIPDGRNIDESYCLAVSVQGAGGNRTQRGRSDSKHTQALIRAFEEVVHERKWVCPDRYGLGTSIELRLGLAYCTELPVLNLYVSDYSTCASGHSVNVYADGTVNYFVNRVDIQPTSAKRAETRKSVIEDHQYYVLTQQELAQIFNLVNGFHLEGDRGCSNAVLGLECTEATPVAVYRSEDATELTALKRRFQEVLPIRWAELASDRNQCPNIMQNKSTLSIASAYISGKHVRQR